MLETFRLDRKQARRGLALLALVGGSIGVAYLLGAGQVARVAGLPADRRSRWALRMFGVRELLLGLGLYHASRRDDPEKARLFAALTALSQVGDLAVTTVALASRGSRRLGLGVWLAAPPTIAFAEMIRRAYARHSGRTLKAALRRHRPDSGWARQLDELRLMLTVGESPWRG